MTDFFAANDIAAFLLTSGVGSELTSGGTFDATYTNKAIRMSGGICKSPQFINPTTGAVTSLTDGWLHFSMNNQSATGTIFTLYSDTGVAVIRVSAPSTSTVRIDYWNGSAWVTTGASYSIGGGTLLDFDLHFVCGASGSLNFYVGNSIATTVTGLNAAVTNCAFLEIGTTAAYLSQILISDTSTIGAKVASLTPVTLSAVNTAWSPNTVGNIAKIGYNDATFIADATLNDKVSYVANDATMPAGMFISSLWFVVRARLNASAPANIAPLLRIGSTNYTGAYNFSGLNNVSFAPAIAAYPVDPSTGVAWTLTNANLAELGFITQT